MYDESGIKIAVRRLAMATHFVVYSSPSLPWGGMSNADWSICVTRRDGYEGMRWAVTCAPAGTTAHPYCLSVDGEEWDYEPIPSSRTDEWLERFRFRTLDAAFDAAEKVVAELREGK